MNHEELKSIKKQLTDLLDLSTNQKGKYDNLLDYLGYDLSEVVGTISDTSTIQEVKKILKNIRRVTGIQRKITEDVEKKQGFISGEYAIIGYPEIHNGGNYYVASINAVKNSNVRYSNSNKPTTFCCIYDKQGNLLLPFDKDNKEISYLDGSNFIVEPQESTNDVKHYRVDNSGIALIYKWDNVNINGRSGHHMNIGDWNKKGLEVITSQGREYLYSFLEGKVLSYGFTKIDAWENFNCDDEIDYTGEYDCCKVTLELSSDIPFEDGTYNPNISTTMIGYIGQDGSLINSMINMKNGIIYLTPSGKEGILEKIVMEELNESAQLNLDSQKLLDSNKNIMMKTLTGRNKK